jgi:hypothetical protein
MPQNGFSPKYQKSILVNAARKKKAFYAIVSSMYTSNMKLTIEERGKESEM